jgi:hypothetical protein
VFSLLHGRRAPAPAIEPVGEPHAA